MIILDTNVLSALMRPNFEPVVERWFGGLGAQTLALAAVTIVEVVRGIQRLPRGQRRDELAARFEELVAPEARLAILPLEEVAARHAGVLMALREAQGRPVADADMMIAGIAVANGAALATRNARDFEDLGLELINPWENAA